MAKHTLKAINGRLKCWSFPGFNFLNAVQDARGYQTREDKNGRTMTGNSMYKTARKEVSAAMGAKKDARGDIQRSFKIYDEPNPSQGAEYKNPGYGIVWLNFYAPYYDRPGKIVWSFRYEHPQTGSFMTKLDIPAAERKTWNQITEADAKRHLNAHLMPPGFWRTLQMRFRLTKAQVLQLRPYVWQHFNARAVCRIAGNETANRMLLAGIFTARAHLHSRAVQRSIQRHRRKCPRYHYGQELEGLLFEMMESDDPDKYLSLF